MAGSLGGVGRQRADLDGAERPFHNLMMFPYPSAEGLHVGNMFAFTGADTYRRFKRLQGYDVFEPIGFDAFGIHSENYAIKLGINPAVLIPQNIADRHRHRRHQAEAIALASATTVAPRCRIATPRDYTATLVTRRAGDVKRR